MAVGLAGLGGLVGRQPDPMRLRTSCGTSTSMTTRRRSEETDACVEKTRLSSVGARKECDLKIMSKSEGNSQNLLIVIS